MTCQGGDEAIRLWQKLRALAPDAGHWPVLLGPTKELTGIKQLFDFNSGSVCSVIDAAAKIAGSDALTALAVEHAEDRGEGAEHADGGAEDASGGLWPTEPKPHSSFLIPFDILTRKPHREMAIALAPTPRPWEVPAFLAAGGWNECPDATTQVAVHRHWNDKYAAEIVGITSDIMEFQVRRPPTNREDAMKLAREQYAFCADIVEQGTETVVALAASLLNAPVWYFWWD